MFSIVQMQLTNQVNIALIKSRILNIFTKQKQTYRYRKQTYLPKGKLERQRESISQELGINHKLLYKIDNQPGPTI